VFPTELYAQVDAFFSSTDNEGTLVLEDAPVLANSLFSIKPYTLSELVIIGNTLPDSFEASFAPSEWTQLEAGICPAEQTTDDCCPFPTIATDVSPLQANAKCLLAKRKVQAASAVLTELFDAALA
jgi:hypothetical protein